MLRTRQGTTIKPKLIEGDDAEAVAVDLLWCSGSAGRQGSAVKDWAHLAQRVTPRRLELNSAAAGGSGIGGLSPQAPRRLSSTIKDPT